MDKLLKWAVLNSATASEDTTKPSEPQRTLKDLDPGIIDAILGEDDATLMRKIMDQLEDPQVPIENKEILFEDLELLVGHIDNAQNMVPLKLWSRVLAFLSDEAPEMRTGGIWIAGTCVQNNPKAKVAFIEADGMSKVLERLERDEELQVRSKALYCISSLLQNAPPIIELFAQKGGYDILLRILKQEKVSLQRKTLFLLQQLAIQCPQEHIPEVLRRPFTHEMVRLIEEKQDDEDIVEKGLRALVETHAAPPTTETTATTVTAATPIMDTETRAAMAKLQTLYPTLHARYASQGALSADEWTRIAQLIA